MTLYENIYGYIKSKGKDCFGFLNKEKEYDEKYIKKPYNAGRKRYFNGIS